MKKHVLGLLTGLMLTGCATEVPIPDTHEVTVQKKVKAAHHWDVIAADIAKETKALVEGNAAYRNKPVYLRPASPETPFSKAFTNLLITQMVRMGVPVSEAPDGALLVRYDTQVIRHRSDRTAHVPGALTALVAGIAVAHNVHTWTEMEKTVGGVALLGGVEWALGHSTALTKTEFLVTTSLVEGGLYRLRKSDVYYLDDEDGSLYQQIKEWRVVG